MLKRIILITLLTLPLSAFAYFQVAGSPVRTKAGQRNKLVHNDYPKHLQVNPLFTLKTQKGYLYKNVKQYTKSHGWRLRWYAKRDYRLVRSTEVAGPSLQAVLNQLFSNYPRLKVRYSQQHKIVTVRFRTKR